MMTQSPTKKGNPKLPIPDVTESKPDSTEENSIVENKEISEKDSFNKILVEEKILVVEEKILHVEKQTLQHHRNIQEETKEKPSTSDKHSYIQEETKEKPSTSDKQHVNDKDSTLLYMGIVAAIVVAILMGFW